jgi:hypothetical protein
MRKRDERAEQFLWGRRLLFLSTVALTLTTPFQETLDHKCDNACFSLIQSTKAFLSLFLAVLNLTSAAIKPEQVLVFASVLNLLVNVTAISKSGSFMIIALSIFSSCSTNQSYLQLRALYSQTWGSNLSDVEKANFFGKLGSTLSLSCIVGPLVGSYVFASYQDTLYTASTLLLVSVYVAYQLLESSKSIRRKLSGGAKETKLSLQSLKISLISPQVLLLLALKFCMAFSYGLFLPVWRGILLDTFHFSPQNYSMYLVMTAVAYTFCQRFMSSRVISVAGKNQDYLLVLCVVILSVGRLVIVHTSSLLLVSVVMLALVGALVTANTLLSIACTNLNQQAYIGSVYGLLDFTESLAGILSPLVGAMFIKNDVYLSLTGVCVTYLCFSLLVLSCFRECFSAEQKVVCSVVRTVKKHRRMKSPTSVIFFRDSELVKLCGKDKSKGD